MYAYFCVCAATEISHCMIIFIMGHHFFSGIKCSLFLHPLESGEGTVQLRHWSVKYGESHTMPVLSLTLDQPESLIFLPLKSLETILRLSCGEMPKPHGETLEDQTLCFVSENEARKQEDNRQGREGILHLAPSGPTTQANATCSRDKPTGPP